jgi:cellulose synthase/poly-beta-1,6-N-acetylglucosamine synthase-like glycosyltransferase
MTVVLTLVVAVMSVALTVLSLTTLWWQMHAWRTPATLQAVGFTRGVHRPTLSFSLLLPARHEEAVLEATLRRMLRIDHPAFQVIPIVGHDDDATRAVADRVAADHPDRVRVVVDHNWPKNKPKALNTALPHCRGDVVGVFDAEDEVDLRLLRRVDATFNDTGADVVQGGVQLMNYNSSWYSLRNCLEYYYWFRSRLHLHARHQFIPLGGNTVFVRSAVLRDVGGWDEACLAEDCDLGVRLSVRGRQVEVCYDPMLVTREETPDSVRSLLKQRTRWNQGFLQVLRKGEWRGLPRRQRLLARFTLWSPFLQAFTGVAVLVNAYCAVATSVPVGVALLSFVPAIATVLSVVFDAVGLREFGRLYYQRPRLRHYLKLVLGMVPYQLVLSAAALRAVAREARGERGWEKTEHVGAHREPDAATTDPSSAAPNPAPVGASR